VRVSPGIAPQSAGMVFVKVARKFSSGKKAN
jgi:hypothetical protein